MKSVIKANKENLIYLVRYFWPLVIVELLFSITSGVSGAVSSYMSKTFVNSIVNDKSLKVAMNVVVAVAFFVLFNKTEKTRIIRSVSHYDIFKKIINLIRENTVINGDVCVLHASCIQMFNKGILLLGESGAGKSTLSAYLHLMTGCECYTDDITLINYNTKVAQGVSEYIHLRAPSLELLPANSNAIYDAFIDRYKIKLTNSTDVKVDYIFLLNWENNSETTVKTIDDPIRVLAKNMYLPYSLKGNIVAANRLAARSNIYALCFSDLFSAYILLRELGG